LHNKNLLYYIIRQDATLRGAKDDLNLKENKTNTSRKKLKSLTEDSNQQPVKRKKKRRRNNKNNNSHMLSYSLWDKMWETKVVYQ
jgi:hypothetical protein